jgi:hypothetical protein
MQPRFQPSPFLKWAAIALIAIIGAIHLVEAPDQFGDATYKGLLFLASGAGAAVALLAIWRDMRLGWWLGAFIAAATAVGYVWSRTIGLPGLPVDPNIFEPMGIVSVVCEVAYLAVMAVAFRRSTVVDERREDRIRASVA